MRYVIFTLSIICTIFISCTNTNLFQQKIKQKDICIPTTCKKCPDNHAGHKKVIIGTGGTGLVAPPFNECLPKKNPVKDLNKIIVFYDCQKYEKDKLDFPGIIVSAYILKDNIKSSESFVKLNNQTSVTLNKENFVLDDCKERCYSIIDKELTIDFDYEIDSYRLVVETINGHPKGYDHGVINHDQRMHKSSKQSSSLKYQATLINSNNIHLHRDTFSLTFCNTKF